MIHFDSFENSFVCVWGKRSRRSDEEWPRYDPSLKHTAFEEVAKKASLRLSQLQTTPSAAPRSLRGAAGRGMLPEGAAERGQRVPQEPALGKARATRGDGAFSFD